VDWRQGTVIEIDRATGSLRLGPDVVIDREVTEADLQRRFGLRDLRMLSRHGQWAIYGFTHSVRLHETVSREQKELFGHAFGASVRVVFRNGRIESIHFLVYGDKERGWEDWSHDRERSRKILHDRILSRSLGDPPYEFSWGGVESGIDQKNSLAEIAIRWSV